MQITQFIHAQWMLILIFLMSGAMLVWPLLQRRMSGMAEVGTAQLTQLINREKAVTLDVRETRELDSGKIPGAIHIPLSQLKARVAELEKFKERPIVVYCARGMRGRSAGSTLKGAGFGNLYNLTGGHKAWKDAGLPLESN